MEWRKSGVRNDRRKTNGGVDEGKGKGWMVGEKMSLRKGTEWSLKLKVLKVIKIYIFCRTFVPKSANYRYNIFLNVGAGGTNNIK